LATTAVLALAGCAQETPHTPGSGGSGTEPPAAEETTSAGRDGAPTSGGLQDGIRDGLGRSRGPDAGTDTAPADDGPSTEDEEAVGPAEVTIGAAGDLLAHAPVLANAQLNAGGEGYDFSPMFAEVSDLLSAPDVTICHMETPLSEDNTNLTVPRVLVFNTPRQLADAVAGAGYDGCDFASNHTWDQGLSGLASTQAVIRGAGLQYAGPVAKEEDPGVGRYEVDGVHVAQLAYTYTIYNSGQPTTDVPAEAPWLADHLWPVVGAKRILEDAQRARKDGAEFVVVSMHWGNEYWTDPTDQQREMAAELLESDSVDLILGTHVHVIQPCEKINGKYVIYGLGNFLSNQSPDTTAGKLRRETQEGMFAQFDLKRDADGTVSSRMTFQPTRVDLEGHVIRKATPDQYPETYERVVETMDLLGEDACDAEPMN
jgi:poly-gamma-glutamate synthesis protein (capsule biosynthesis protein)